MRILITGPQGSGKTTQAKKISEYLSICLIKTGSLIREYVANGGEKAQAVRQLIDKGEMVDDELVASLIKERLKKPECQNGIVVDGYPRRMSQLECFNPQYDLVICIDISDDEAKKRLLARKREDDTPIAIEKRIALYHQETKKVLDYYQNEGKLAKVNGEQPESQVSQEIVKVIQSNPKFKK